ncbi:EAL domain-containing response regulator [Pseudomonas protegens]|uniref:EAL domain-containing response regulator n=1 Tax=Pseudomonas protegens TaxID=380021 RepID=A0A7G7XC11_9PSED|nr:EAL domain-containing response regulator [Pseudomonas protegens]QNH77506.1 EAL domain-containing response regulator [Pseudomonas protegens]QNL06702.1 EAL domain-containing response regulator [Pseudomonas protegens]
MPELSVLVLEDQPFQRLVAVSALRKAGIGLVCEAADGNEALTALKVSGGVDIAICDLRMRGMDGLTFLHHASQSGLLRSVILSSDLDPVLRQATVSMIQSLGLEFLGDLGKPFNLGRAKLLLRRYSRPQVIPSTLVDGPAALCASEVQRGLNNGEFEAYYQPKVHLVTGQLKGAEVLARWNHPHLGILPPIRFLPIMEAHDLVGQLFNSLLSQGLALQKELSQLLQPVELAFNLHVSQLASMELVEHINQSLEQSQLPARGLMFEVTESGLVLAPASSLETLVRLRLLGCGLAMDDFGAGYSSLERLCEFPFSQVKLDASFVRKLDFQPRSRAIIRSSVSLCESLGLSLVIEGVETREQSEQLRELGCTLAQGFLFARPMPGKHFISYCQDQSAK